MQIEKNKKFIRNRNIFFIVTILFLYPLISWVLGTADKYYFEDTSNIGNDIKKVVLLIILAILQVVLHEFIHFIFIKALTKKNVKFGFAYVQYEGSVKKEHAIIFLLAPFLVLTLLTIIFNHFYSHFAPLLATLVLLNYVGSASDITNSYFIIKYWRKHKFYDGDKEIITLKE